MTALTRQDVQSVVDAAKNKIIESTASRQEVQTTIESARDRLMTYMHDFYLQNQQQFFRTLHTRNNQYTQRLTAMESRLGNMEQELRIMRQTMERLASADLRPQQIVVPAPEKSQHTQPGNTQEYYTYVPA